MAKGPSYRVAYRRRREHRTDYKARRTLATSTTPRLVVRQSGRGILTQIIRSEKEGDYIATQATSAELAKKYGWKGGTKNTPAAYLLGFIVGYKALKGGTEAANLDIGLRTPSKGSMIFAAAMGAADAGLKVPCDSDIMPSSDRVEGADIASYAKAIAETPDYANKFSDYLRKSLRPEEIVDHFRSVKSKIQEEFS